MMTDDLQQRLEKLEKHMLGQRRRNRWLKRELRTRNEQISLLKYQVDSWKQTANRPYMINSLVRALREVTDQLDTFGYVDNEKMIDNARKIIKWVEESK